MLPDLIQGIRGQSRLSISQAISLIEDNRDEGAKLLSEIYKNTGNAYKIGITGPPGAGKSSLTHNLISAFRKNDKRVAVIAVDPTSPFSGGAVLGDRIRMTSHFSDPHVFVRSMATRGSRGGLASKTQEVGETWKCVGITVSARAVGAALVVARFIAGNVCPVGKRISTQVSLVACYVVSAWTGKGMASRARLSGSVPAIFSVTDSSRQPCG